MSSPQGQLRAGSREGMGTNVAQGKLAVRTKSSGPTGSLYPRNTKDQLQRDTAVGLDRACGESTK